MSLMKKKSKIIIWLIAALILAGGLLAAGREEKKEKTAYQILFFGDSIPGLVRDESGIASMISEKTGKSVVNLAFSGSCVGRIEVDREPDFRKEVLSLVALVKSIHTNDFGSQQAMRYREAVSEEFEAMIDVMETVDFSKVETVIIEQGVNDYFGAIPVHNRDDVMDEYSFAGALTTSIQFLREVNPNVRIVLVTPTYCWLTDRGQTCEEYVTGHGNLEAYVNEELRIAEEYNVDIIDIYHDFYPNEAWEDWSIYTTDGLHPNEAGREKIAERISEYLKGEL